MVDGNIARLERQSGLVYVESKGPRFHKPFKPSVFHCDSGGEASRPISQPRPVVLNPVRGLWT